jgi:hypothetical protein
LTAISKAVRDFSTGPGGGPEFPRTGSSMAMAAHAPIPAVRYICRERLSWVENRHSAPAATPAQNFQKMVVGSRA